MILHYKRAIQDIRNNRFLNAVTIITISLAILIVSAFTLFFINANEIMNTWKKGIRVMAYLKPDLSQQERKALQEQIAGMYGVQSVRFISREEALAQMKELMRRQSSLLDGLAENPLPDALEIRAMAASQTMEKIEDLATRLESLVPVADVEYGQKWLGRFSGIFDLFKFSGYALGSMFFMAAVFIVANTTRLVLYSRREEVEIMRLVGATDGFIKAPFYFEGLIQGAIGGALGLVALFFAYLFLSSRVQQGFATGSIQVHFLSFGTISIIVACSICVGWLGCFFALRQFLNE